MEVCGLCVCVCVCVCVWMSVLRYIYIYIYVIHLRLLCAFCIRLCIIITIHKVRKPLACTSGFWEADLLPAVSHDRASFLQLSQDCCWWCVFSVMNSATTNKYFLNLPIQENKVNWLESASFKKERPCCKIESYILYEYTNCGGKSNATSTLQKWLLTQNNKVRGKLTYICEMTVSNLRRHRTIKKIIGLQKSNGKNCAGFAALLQCAHNGLVVDFKEAETKDRQQDDIAKQYQTAFSGCNKLGVL